MKTSISHTLKRPASHMLGVMLLVALAGCQGSYSVNPNNNSGPDGATPSPTPWLEGHLSVYPESIDFGPTGVGCPNITQLTVRNEGQQPVSVLGTSMATNSSTEFAVDYLRTELQPFESIELNVLYTPINPGFDEAALLIESDAKDQSVLAVPVQGSDSSDNERLDRFTQGDGIPTDFIWLLDNSGSMNRETEQIVLNFEYFMEDLFKINVDYHMALLTTDLGDRGKYLGFYGEEELPWITRDMGTDVIDVFKEEMLRQSYGASGEEEGLSSLLWSLSDEYRKGVHQGFLREEARLAIIVFSDEEDHSDLYVFEVEEQLNYIKGAENIVFSSVVADRDMSCSDERGAKFLDLARIYDGIADEICSNDYSNLMDSLGRLGAILEDTFVLEQLVNTAYPITVTVDGKTVDNSPLNGWVYDETQNAIIFSGMAVPTTLAEIHVAYIPVQGCL